MFVSSAYTSIVFLSFIIILQFIVGFDAVAIFQYIVSDQIIPSQIDRTHHHRHELNSECITTKHTLGVCTKTYDCPESRYIVSLGNICYLGINSYETVVCCEQIKSGVSIPVNLTKSPATFTKSSKLEDDSEIDIKNAHLPPKADDELYTTIPSLTAKQVFDTMEGIFGRKNEKIFERVKNSTKISNKKCVEHSKYLINSRTMEDFDLIYSGKILPRAGGNPQIAAIGWKSSSENIEWKCRGSFISSKFVLTAAHCLFENGQEPNMIRVGDLNLLKSSNIASKDFNITGIWIHPEYIPNLMFHDIALIRVSPPLPYSMYIKPACLWTESDIPLEAAISFGYGSESFIGKSANQLYEGNLTIISNELCEKALGTRSDIQMILNGIIDSQLCATDISRIIDTCQGISGSPLLFRTGSTTDMNQHLIGIASYPVSCAAFSPIVYTKVSSYTDWIESIVWPEEFHRL